MRVFQILCLTHVGFQIGEMDIVFGRRAFYQLPVQHQLPFAAPDSCLFAHLPEEFVVRRWRGVVVHGGNHREDI